MNVFKWIVGIVVLGLFLRYGGIELLSELYDLSNQEYTYSRATGWIIGALIYVVWRQRLDIKLLNTEITELQKQTLDIRYKLNTVRRAIPKPSGER
ncbi:hypothetical protein VPH159E362A_0024 [Vibrio phage 159E36-2a]